MTDFDVIMDQPVLPGNETVATNSTDTDAAVKTPQDDLLRGWRFNSTFADHDLDNVFDILPHPGPNSDVGGKQLLYAERYFPDFVLRMGQKEDDWSYNDPKYDGYMYYQEMAWEVPEQPGVVRGLL